MSLRKKLTPNRDDEWGNIELPTLSDDELLSKNWERIDVNKKSAEYRDKDGSWTKLQKEKNQRLAKDPNWLKANRESVLRNAKDPKWLEASRRGAKARSEKGKKLKAQGRMEEHKKLFGTVEKHSKKTLIQMSASAKKRWASKMKPVMADGKKFKSTYEACKKLKVHNTTILYRLKVGKKGYKWLKR